MDSLHVITIAGVWFLCFLYFSIPAFVTYYVGGNVIKRVSFGLGALLLQSALVLGAWYLAARNGDSALNHLALLMYGICMSFLGVLGALISLVVDRVRRVR